MRITSGQFKGRILASPEGLGTRPTSDRARQAVFNILLHASWRPFDDLEGLPVMDAFAGTGALGLEALSRGAAEAVFVENDRRALAACRRNVESFGLGDRARIMAADAAHLAPRPDALAQRRLVFLDPPYGFGLGTAAVAALARGGWLADDCLLVMEMARKTPEPVPAGFRIMDERHYGVAQVRFLLREDACQ